MYISSKNSPLLDEIKDVESVLKYAFWLEPELSETSIQFYEHGKTIEFIDSCLQSTLDACKPTRKSLQFYMSPSKFKGEDGPWNTPAKLGASSLWDIAIKQECIMASYSLIRKLISTHHQLDVKNFLQYKYTLNDFDYEQQKYTKYANKLKEEIKYYEKELSKHRLSRENLEKHNIEESLDTVMVNIAKTEKKIESLQNEIKKLPKQGTQTVNLYGLHHILSTDSMSVNVKLSPKYNSVINSKQGSFTSQLNKYFKKINKVVKTDQLFGNGINTGEDIFYQLHMLELSYYLMGRNSVHDGSTYGASKIIDKFDFSEGGQLTKRNFDKYKTDCSRVISELAPCQSTVDTKFMNNADKLYCRYMFEKAFPISFADTLYQSIIKAQDNDDYVFLTENIVSLAKCATIPCTFSRNFIIQMAIAALPEALNNPLYEDPKAENIGGYYMRQQETDTKVLKQTLWLKQFKEMINVSTKLVFPLHTSHFFISLWSHYYKINNFNEEQTTKHIYEHLTAYLNNNQKIMSLFMPDKGTYFGKEEISNNTSHVLNEVLVQPFVYSEKDKIQHQLYTTCTKSIGRQIYNNDTSSMINFKQLKELDPFKGEKKQIHYYAENLDII